MPYLDASVLVSLFVTDSHSEKAIRWVGDGTAVRVSQWSLAEASSALSLRVRLGHLGRQDREAIEARLDEWIRSVAEPLVLKEGDMATARRLLRDDTDLRTPDALHLAITFDAGMALATFDKRLAASAKRIGVEVIDFGD